MEPCIGVPFSGRGDGIACRVPGFPKTGVRLTMGLWGVGWIFMGAP